MTEEAPMTVVQCGSQIMSATRSARGQFSHPKLNVIDDDRTRRAQNKRRGRQRRRRVADRDPTPPVDGSFDRRRDPRWIEWTRHPDLGRRRRGRLYPSRDAIDPTGHIKRIQRKNQGTFRRSQRAGTGSGGRNDRKRLAGPTGRATVFKRPAGHHRAGNIGGRRRHGRR